MYIYVCVCCVKTQWVGMCVCVSVCVCVYMYVYVCMHVCCVLLVLTGGNPHPFAGATPEAQTGDTCRAGWMKSGRDRVILAHLAECLRACGVYVCVCADVCVCAGVCVCVCVCV